ncbi:hydroxypyruvate reductase-like [Hibiscus syriacus]|uniref:hydroxypyruvate reductase-like n=1 Tax=Hibiscus syriacus TaxID=106335 RepID=UPI001922610C|nr:hydroxypyruvate reductase-like [Hibiscus syriacus]
MKKYPWQNYTREYLENTLSGSQNYTREYLEKYPFIQVDQLPLEQVPDHIGNYDLCVVKTMRFDSNVIARAKQMKLIMQFGVGLEGVDIDAATKKGIKVARIPGDATGNAASWAEMAICLMLGLLRKQNEMLISVKQKTLEEPTGDTHLGKTVFILGCGDIGIEFSKRLKPFGVKVIATKRSWPSNWELLYPKIIDDLIDKKGIHGDIYEFASDADTVVCCLSLYKETVGIVNESFISSMKRFGDLLVNVARGGPLDYEAVVHHLESGQLGGLGMDVAWTEPFDPDDPILKFNNVILTPHVSGITEHSCISMAKVIGDVALQLHAGNHFTGKELVN